MKIGVSYIAFDGVELLASSIAQIREHVNYINVVYQDTSWFGKGMSQVDHKELIRLKESKVIDELIKFETFSHLKDKSTASIIKAKEFERRKRQLGLTHCLRQKCTHFLGMDVDEFYDGKEFSQAKLQILKNGWDRTAVRFINYVKVPTLHRGYDSSRVPFICRLTSAATMGRSFFVRCDPTRGINNGGKKHHEFSTALIKMHHMETVRRDLITKYESTTRGIFQRSRITELVNRINQVNESTSTFDFGKIIFPKVKGVNLTRCTNQFNIPFDTWKK